jgi:uncharacterized protein with NRDE domain
MCLLVVHWDPAAVVPLTLGANRDERFDREAAPFGVLRKSGPRVLGGRDLRAGGTWLAVNELGVVAGLTNRPLPDGRDDSRASRGELPIMAATAPTASDGVDHLVRAVGPRMYNPAWLMVGDRESLHYVVVDDEEVTSSVLEPGVHVLENKPLGEPSPKIDHVLELIGQHDTVWDSLDTVLADHTLPSGPGPDDAEPTTRMRHLVQSACVHTESYGTRCSTQVRVVDDPSTPPLVRVAEGPPCVTPYTDVTGLWDARSLDS